jgi:hypothetical protein
VVRVRPRLTSILAGALLVACGNPSLEPVGNGGTSGGASSGGTAGSDVTAEPITPSPRGRVARLSHAQWENSVRDLLRLDDDSGLSSDFPVQAHAAGYLFDNPAEKLQVDQVLASTYTSAAATLAESVTADGAQLARILPESGADETERARTFIQDFGARAFRRPLAADEVTGYLELFESGRDSYADVTGFVAGIRLLLETFLQSPHFLYRLETSTEQQEQWVALSGWEMAQRLSYLLTNSMPDAELFLAAAEGRLADRVEIRRHAERLLETPSARRAFGHFQDQLWALDAYTRVAPSPELFPNTTAQLGPSALAAARLFLEDLVFDQQQGFTELLSTTRAFADAELASVYGLEGVFGPELVAVQLPASERRGLLTQVGFLAANSTSINPDPIHRGVFVAKQVLCRQISAPPDDVTPLPPSGLGTNRQIVEEHTQTQSSCKGCHERLINPYGFVFENYDATGAFRVLDRGLPVDASASPILDGAEVAVENAVEFAESLSESREAHACFARHLLEYAQGMTAADADQPLIELLARASREQRTSIRDLVLALVTSDSFILRNPEQLP